MIGDHLIKAWSSTQPIVAMSSGEAEYYAMVKGASTALGLQSMASEVGYPLSIVLCVDSSAAIGISSRRGLGKVRHIEFEDDDLVYKYNDFGFISFDLWQVKGGTICDNIIITDDQAEAEDFAKKVEGLERCGEGEEEGRGRGEEDRGGQEGGGRRG